MEDIDDLVFLEGCGGDLDDALVRIDLGNSLTSALGACDEIRAKMPSLEALIESVELLEKHVKTNAVALKNLGEDLETLGADLEKAETAEDLDFVAREVQGFQRKFSVLFRLVKDVIDNFERSEVRPLEALVVIFSEEKKKIADEAIEKIWEEFKNFERSPVSFPESISKIEHLIEEVNSEIESVAGNSEMREFLLSFSRDGEVALSQVSAEILVWLRENNMLQNFRVVSN